MTENLNDLTNNFISLVANINRLHQIKLTLTEEEVANVLRE